MCVVLLLWVFDCDILDGGVVDCGWCLGGLLFCCCDLVAEFVAWLLLRLFGFVVPVVWSLDFVVCLALFVGVVVGYLRFGW